MNTIPSLKQPGTSDLKFSSFSEIESPRETITFPYQEMEGTDVVDATVKEIKDNCQLRNKLWQQC